MDVPADVNPRHWVAIYSVIVRYARALDTKNYPLFLTCFTADAVIRYVTPDMSSDITFPNPQAAAAGLQKIHAPLQATLHRVSNHAISIDGHRATGRTYVDVLEVGARPDGIPVTLNHIGYYDDEFLHRDDEWRMSARTFQGVYSGGRKDLIDLPS
jgi:hypothetical protein